ncbi:MAG: hypothetical protein ACFCBU_06290, partial [Cyanophyceae cyanobacterium]
LLAGAAFGAAAGLLYAPRRGRDTRRVNKQSVKKSVGALPELAEGAASTAQVQAGKMSAAAAERLTETLERLRVAAAVGIAASQAIAKVSEDSSDDPAASDEPRWNGEKWSNRERKQKRANIRYSPIAASNGAWDGETQDMPSVSPKLKQR